MKAINVDSFHVYLIILMNRHCYIVRYCISFGDIDLVRLCSEIGSFLANVEIVLFGARSKRGHDEAEFLKYCPNVKQLSIYNSIYEGHD